MTPRKILYFALGPVCGSLLGIITLPIIAWFFSQEDVGKMALLQVVLSFSTLFFTLGLDQAYVREFHEATNRPLLLKTAALPGLLLLLISLVVCLAFGSFLSEMVFSVSSTALSYLLAISLLCSYISRFLSLVLRMNERGLAFSMSQLLPKAFVLIIILNYLLFDVEKSFDYLLLANTFAIMFACLIFLWNTRVEWSLSVNNKINKNHLKEMLCFGFPLILGGLAFWGLTSSDRIFLSHWSTYSELGVYSVSVSFAAAATIFQSVFSTVWAPTVYKWASKDEGLDKVVMVSRYVLLLVIIIFCIAGLFSWIVPSLLPGEYKSVQWILITCLSYPLLYTLSETTVVGIGIARKSVYAMLAALLALMVNLVCNYFLVPKFGASGAGSSTAIAFWIFLVFRTEFSILVWKPLPRFTLYGLTFLAIIGAILGALFQEWFGLFIYLYWSFLLLLSFWVFRAELSVVKYKAFEFFHGKNSNDCGK